MDPIDEMINEIEAEMSRIGHSWVDVTLRFLRYKGEGSNINLSFIYRYEFTYMVLRDLLDTAKHIRGDYS